MATVGNRIFPAARSAFAEGALDWGDDDFKVYLLDGDYDLDVASQVYVSDLPSGSILGVPTSLATPAVLDDGVLDGGDVSYPGVALGETAERVVIAQDTGDPDTSLLVIYMDTAEDTTPISRAGDGSNIPVIWPSVPTKIAKL